MKWCAPGRIGITIVVIVQIEFGKHAGQAKVYVRGPVQRHDDLGHIYDISGIRVSALR